MYLDGCYICIVIYGLFQNISSSESIVSSRSGIAVDVERSGCDPVQLLSRHFPGGPEDNHDKWSPGRFLNVGLARYEERLQRHLVSCALY